MKSLLPAAFLVALSAPVWAQEATGDAAAGESQFNRQCTSCHVIVDDNGETLAGRNARTGPNLYNVVSRGMGMLSEFNYGDSLVELGEGGMMWDEANFVAYVQNPTAFLREALDDNRARGKMAYQVRDAQQAADIFAYLVSIDAGL